MQRIGARLAEAGVDLLDISGGLGGTGTDRYKQQGFFVPLANDIKVASNTLVVGIGNITEAAYADQVIHEGLVDLVAVGRPLLRDASWAERTLRALAQK
jgi:NADPH2 dehydrogenase